MPEAPELYVLREYLAPRIEGAVIESARELRPLVVRNYFGEPLAEHIAGRTILGIDRKGKMLRMELSGGATMFINPMLTGELLLVDLKQRMLKSTILTVNLGDVGQLRYVDVKRMGQIYYLGEDRFSEVPRLENQGPDVLDAPMDLSSFEVELRKFRGEVKGVLTRGQLVSGIGNAYADEVLWEAGVYPFRKVTRLSGDEVSELRDSLYRVPLEAVEMLRERFAEAHPRKARDLLKVHGNAGDQCPRCGSTISSVMSRKVETNFCRQCQPGTMFD